MAQSFGWRTAFFFGGDSSLLLGLSAMGLPLTRRHGLRIRRSAVPGATTLVPSSATGELEDSSI